MKTWYTIKAAAAGADTVEISVYDEIGYWGVTAKAFTDDLKAKVGDGVKNISLLVNSPGGSVFDGWAIYNALRATGKQITVKVMGIAASMASVLVQAGDVRQMPANSMMMVHNALTGVYGDAEDLRDVAATLDKIDLSIIATYAKRSGKSEDEMRDLMKADSWLTAAEALEHGLIDEITDEVKAKASFDLERVPENIRTLFKAALEAPAADEPAVVEPPVVEPAAAPAPLAGEIEARAKAAGVSDYSAVFATDPKVTDIATAQAAIDTARDIKAFAALTKRPDSAAALIRARKTVAEARAALADELAEADAATVVDTAQKTAQVQATAGAADISATGLWAEINARGTKK